MIKLFFQLLFLADWWSSSEIRIHAPKEILEDMSHVSAVVLMNHHIGKIFKKKCAFTYYKGPVLPSTDSLESYNIT